MLGAGPVALRLGRRLRHCRLDFAVGDVAFVAHGAENDLGSFFRRLWVARRRQAGRGLEQACKQCRLAEVHVARRLVEVAPRSGFHAISVGAEEHPVEIHRQDLILGIFLLEPEGEQHFLHLALQRALRRQEQVLGKLLCQRRATLHHAAGGEVRHHGAGKPQRIYAEMRVEAAVLNGDDGLRNIGRHVFQRQCLAAGGAAIGDDVAADRQNLDVRRALGDRPASGARHARAVIETGRRRPWRPRCRARCTSRRVCGQGR